jgi:hypothetical protein
VAASSASPSPAAALALSPAARIAPPLKRSSNQRLTCAATTRPGAFVPQIQPYCCGETPYRSMKTNGEPER